MNNILPVRAGFSLIGDTAGNVAGQLIWAAGQMAVLIFLSHMGLQRLVGVYAVGLGVFAVATLFFGLNLRIAISTDRERAIGFRAAIGARIIACLVALPIAILAMSLMSAAPEELLVASVLVATRVPDQISDVMVGFYLRDSARGRISASFIVRGTAALGMLAAAWGLGLSALELAFALLFVTSLASIAVDVLPEWRRHTGQSGSTIRELSRMTRTISSYPALDALHSNSLRFAMVMVTGPAFYGLVAIAQVLFTPFQIVTSALGYGYLESARNAHDKGGKRSFRRHVYVAILLGAAIGAAFVGVCLLLPDFLGRLLFAAQWENAKLPLLVAAFALCLQPISGFLSLMVVASHARTSYVTAPVVGLVVIWATVPFLLLSDSPSLGLGASAALVVAMIFVLSFAARISVSLQALSKMLRQREPGDAAAVPADARE